MALKLGSNAVDSVYLGSTAVDAVYKGSTLIWSASALPLGYKRCNWLYSTGTQWIDTEYTPVVGDRMTISYIQYSNSGYCSLFSAGTGTYQLIFLNGYSGDPYEYFKYFSSGGSSALKRLSDGATYTVVFDSDGTITIDDATVITSEVSKTKGTVNTTLRLFIRANGNSRGGKICSFMIDDVMDLIPCLDAEGVPCMYDTVRKMTLYNAGSGTFEYELA